jgi:glycosyltransferase involved in cell wall biosynthesis
MLSAHEGFGVPLVEAMGQGLPIVAVDDGAVAEVLDGAGVLLDDRHPERVAVAVTALLGDPSEQARLVARGRARFASLGLADAGERLVAAVVGVGREPAPR